jgi:hypothetical protein
MKLIKNTSMQGLSIPFGTPKGIQTLFFPPKKQIEVPSDWKSKIAENLVHRRMLQIIEVNEPQVVVKSSALKKTRNSRESN